MEEVWNGIKGRIRVIIRIIVEALHRVVINIFDTLFACWSKKCFDTGTRDRTCLCFEASTVQIKPLVANV